MTKVINIHYQLLPNESVSTDQNNWIPISCYNNYNQPYFNLTKKLDWCTVEISKDRRLFVCFVKLQNNGNSQYFKGFRNLNYQEDIITFECSEIIKNETTNKWIKKM